MVVVSLSESGRKDTAMPISRGRPRPCTYCHRQDADCCVSVLPDTEGGRHIYAHRACAEKRNHAPLYVFVDESPAGSK